MPPRPCAPPLRARCWHGCRRWDCCARGLRPSAVLASEREALALIARHGAGLIACPQASLRAGGAALVRLEGQRTALGTDSPAAVGALDLLAEARVAALLSGLPAAETLRLATLGGATVLGLQAQIGSLEVGKAADLVCIDLDPLACRCSRGVEAAILFGATRSDVSDVWSGGRAAVREHRLLAFDTEELKQLPGELGAATEAGGSGMSTPGPASGPARAECRWCGTCQVRGGRERLLGSAGGVPAAAPVESGARRASSPSASPSPGNACSTSAVAAACSPRRSARPARG